MSWLSGGQQQQGPDPVQAAKVEMEMYTDLFNKIASSCFTKCAARRHRDPDITLGEMTCTVSSTALIASSCRWLILALNSCFAPQDRCVSKYLETQQRVGVILQKANEAQLEQQQNMAQMQQRLG
ncbi:hypothetical protein FisN_34Lh015 [Fistulifera solaris]|uniref:Mitochondrial import inner membrane translocase subunit n=1 Tax=Fistulifera solaris TaxID=1519565 RepID=A0A1Z5JHK8_FISSO|nr:hypothetical protein FisN_34Lh015 [Fistulifera solaris]|eukprot:GAX13416.1 hypothetical protein FisN_34Lh015 [Fistulifera solaris]